MVRRAGLAAVLLAGTAGAASAEPLNTLNELWRALGACWIWPPAEQVVEGMETTVRFSLTRDGAILGEPRFTYSRPGIAPEARAAYQRAAAESFVHCTPFSLTPEFGGAIAGRPISLRLVEPRTQRRT
jgi:hypothetical protein